MSVWTEMLDGGESEETSSAILQFATRILAPRKQAR
jgi:hypothetical protein